MKVPLGSLVPIVLVAAASTSYAQRGGVLRSGEPLPNLELPTIDGEQTINLAELRGKKVLLIQFASW